MSLVIKGGTIITADCSFKGDVYCEGGLIKAVGDVSNAPASAEVIDASGQFVMPGGIDPHTHMELPFMGHGGVGGFLFPARPRALPAATP